MHVSHIVEASFGLKLQNIKIFCNIKLLCFNYLQLLLMQPGEVASGSFSEHTHMQNCANIWFTLTPLKNYLMQ